MAHGARAGVSAAYTLRSTFSESRTRGKPVLKAELSRQLSDSQT